MFRKNIIKIAERKFQQKNEWGKIELVKWMFSYNVGFVCYPNSKK